MSEINFKIDNIALRAKPGKTVLQAALASDIYIPHLCQHPQLNPLKKSTSSAIIYQGDRKIEGEAGVSFQGCRLCMVEIDGNLEKACQTIASENMAVCTTSERVKKARRNSLCKIFAHHPHACLVCAQRQGCSRTQCSSNVPENERCCSKLGNCELQKLAGFIGMPPELGKYIPQGYPAIENTPLFKRDYELCVGCLRCVRICSEIRGVDALGFTMLNGESIVGTLQPKLTDACKFCTACVEVCPTGALVDKDIKPSTKNLLPCKNACPAKVDIPKYVRFIRQGRYDDAVAAVMEKAPFPESLGYVCFHTCESVCRRGEVDEKVAICSLKRYACEHATGQWKERILPDKPSGKKVAVIGAGPGGLTTAYFLTLKGHKVTVYESNAKAGGLLRYGIPRYRLPEEVLDKEIAFIENLGVSIECESKIDRLASLAREYDALLIAVGASHAKALPIDDANMEIYQGIEFLKAISDKAIDADFLVGKKVVIIGGGNVAIDAARSALRLKAKGVHIYYRRSQDEMPAYEWEIEEAKAEGVELHCHWMPISSNNRKGSGLDFIHSETIRDSVGRRTKCDNSITKHVTADIVISAIGQEVDIASLGESRLKITDDKNLEVNKDMATSQAGIYGAGDATGTPASVIEAIASGQKAACAIDRHLGGNGNIERIFAPSTVDPYIGREENFATKPRRRVEKMPIAERIESFAAVEHCYDRQNAHAEANRCLQCDLRLKLTKPVLPPEKWLELSEKNLEKVPQSEGVYQLQNSDEKVIAIKGTDNLHCELLDKLHSATDAKRFSYEQEPMFTRLETELIQQHLQRFGEMPGSGDDLDDLF